MASKKYVIWDKKSEVITPIGEVLTPEQWIARRPIANIVPTVVSGGVVNGSFFGVYSEMVDIYENMGCDFTGCTTEQEHLDAIEAFEFDKSEKGIADRVAELEEQVAIHEENDAELLYQICLLQLGITEDDM